MVKRMAILHWYTGLIGRNRPLVCGISALEAQYENSWNGISNCFFAMNYAKIEIISMDNEETRNALIIIELLKENLDLGKEEDIGEENAVEDL